MCNVNVKIPTLSIKKIERLLNRKSFKAKTVSINKLVELEKELVFPDDLDFGRISVEKLKNFLKVKKVLFSTQQKIPIRELEAIRDGWSLQDCWTREEATSYMFLENPVTIIGKKLISLLRDGYYFVNQLQVLAKKYDIHCSIDELVEEFWKLDNMFCPYSNEKLFLKDFQPKDEKKLFLSLRSLQLEIEKLAPSVLDITGTYLAGKKIFQKKEQKLPISDYFYIKGVLAKFVFLAEYIKGV